MKNTFAKYYFLLLLIIILQQAGLAQTNDVNSKVNQSIIDLQKNNFKESVSLNNKWSFYWKEFLQPNTSPKQKPILVDFPFRWDGYKVNNQTLPSKGFATFATTVLLPHNHEILSIAMPDTYCAYNLFINGDLICKNGEIDSTEKGYKPYWEYTIKDLPLRWDTLNIILQIANFSHSKGGITKEIIIGKESTVLLDRKKSESIDLLLTGCLLMGGLFFLGLFFLGNRDRAILLFSLYSIVFSYRIIGTDNYVLHSILPNLNWYLTIRIEYATLFLGFGLFFLYTRYLYPNDAKQPLLKVIVYTCLSFAVAAVTLPTYWITFLITPFLAIMLFCLIYVPLVYVRAFRNKRPGAKYALISTISLIIVCLISFFHYLGLTPPLQLLNLFGYIGFFFFQSLILSHRVSFTLKKAKLDAEMGLKAKSEFLSTMSHEIRTPLNSVVGMSHIMLTNNPREYQKQHLEVLLFSANNLLGIVNDILDFSKIEAGKISFESVETDIYSIINNIFLGSHSEALNKGIELKVDFDKQLSTKVMCDPTRLAQVINNLVFNAIKFTQKGSVLIHIKIIHQTDEEVTVYFAVKDTGIGIEADKQKLIFEQFTQADSSTSRSFGGTGLGLSICKRILELQDTELKIESEIGKGSIFYFVQQFKKAGIAFENHNTALNSLPNEEDMPFTGLDILLVEDNAMNIMVAKTFLERWGATVDIANNGQQALQLFHTSAKYKLILMDMHMPVMDGYTATKILRDEGVTLPIIALTASLPKEIEEHITELGINDIVVKPFVPNELYRKVYFSIFPK